MREIIIGGNWKMNTTPEEGVTLAQDILTLISGLTKVKSVIFPPATHIAKVVESLRNSPLGVGGQNIHWENSGAYTGEIAGAMLKKIGCEWVIIGHSERRQFFGETDKSVNRRLKKALEYKLRPIVCIGESLADREAGKTFQILEKQIEIGLDDVPLEGLGGIVIAYEPIWAIGTGVTATTDQAQEAHNFIRMKLANLYDRDAAEGTVIQYGGSMNDKNAFELISKPDVDGGLIGGASLKAESFAGIIRAAQRVLK